MEPSIMDTNTTSNSSPNPSSDEFLLNAGEVANILRVPRSWVYSHLKELPVIRLGRYVRFRRSEIDRFLEQREHACQ
jgi:excisionase family DNA binding protein